MMYLEKIPSNLKSAWEKKVIEIASYLGIYPEWLIWLMNHESGLDAQAVFKAKGDSSDGYTRAKNRATGLIGFMPSTAKSLGTTTQNLYLMNEVEQLDYVKKFFQHYAGKFKSVVDLGKAAFFPAMIGKPRDWVLHTDSMTAQTVRNWNPPFDSNNDGQITVGEYEDYYIKKGVEQTLAKYGVPFSLTGSENFGSGLERAIQSGRALKIAGIVAGSAIVIYGSIKIYQHYNKRRAA